MRKIYFLAASLMLSAGAMAQLNLGFETWAPGVATLGETTDPHPTGWQSALVGQAISGGIDNDLASAALGGTITIGGATGMPTKQSTTAPSQGTSNISLQTFTLSGLSAQGVPDGIYSSSISQAYPKATNITSVTFEYKSNFPVTDTALAIVTASGPTGTVGQGYLEITGNNAAWTLGTATMTYFTTDAVDTLTITFASSAGGLYSDWAAPTADGSMLQIDDVKIVEPSTAGIKENTTLNLSVYPNPANNVLNFDMAVAGSSISIVSMDGKIVSTTAIKGTNASVDVSSLTSGMYFYTVTAENGMVVRSSFVKN